MVSLKIHLLATIMLISKAYSQVATGGGSPQRYGSVTPSIVPGGQFIVPAIIKPLLPSCQAAAPAQPAPCAPKKQVPAAPSAPYADEDDDNELDKLLYLLISNIIESKKGSGKKQSNPSSIFESSACPSDGYDDYDYCSYSPSVLYSSASNSEGSDRSCPEIRVFVRPVQSANADC
ncbi:uncharacterized protein LOC134754128 [Cydia strobilella]|uniref:uncharacterized protein LOC134754128 n=1 Tax=Cydia strobilella TaxID=1100964 RepID=UPI003006C64E